MGGTEGRGETGRGGNKSNVGGGERSQEGEDGGGGDGGTGGVGVRGSTGKKADKGNGDSSSSSDIARSISCAVSRARRHRARASRSSVCWRSARRTSSRVCLRFFIFPPPPPYLRFLLRFVCFCFFLNGILFFLEEGVILSSVCFESNATRCATHGHRSADTDAIVAYRASP